MPQWAAVCSKSADTRCITHELLEETIDDFVLLPVPVQLYEVVEVHAAGGVLAGLVDRRRQHHLLQRFGGLELLHGNNRWHRWGYLKRSLGTHFYIRQSNFKEVLCAM